MNATLLYHRDRLGQPRAVLLRCNDAPAIGDKAGSGKRSASALMKTLWSLMDQVRREHLARVGAALFPPFRPGQVLFENDRQGMDVRDVKLAQRHHHDIEPQRVYVGRDGSLSGTAR